MVESDSEIAEKVRRTVKSHGGWEEEQTVEVSGSGKYASPFCKIYENAAISYSVESPKGDVALEIMIERLSDCELSAMEELDVANTVRSGNFGEGRVVARKTSKSGARITILNNSGKYAETKLVTSCKKEAHTTVDVTGTRKFASPFCRIYKGDAAASYVAETGSGEKVVGIKIEPLTRKELWEGMDLDLARTEASGNFRRSVSHRMAEGGVRMTITDGKYAETKMVTYR